MESSRFPRMTSDVLPGQQIRATPKVKNVLCCPTLSYRGNRWLLPRVAKQRNGPLGMAAWYSARRRRRSDLWRDRRRRSGVSCDELLQRQR